MFLGKLVEHQPEYRPLMERVHRLSAQGTGGRRLLVRPLGHQLYLRRLVGAAGLRDRRRPQERPEHPTRGGLAEMQATGRRRLGRGQLTPTTTLAPACVVEFHTSTAFQTGLALIGTDWRPAKPTLPKWRPASSSCCATSRRTASGRTNVSPRRDSPRCFYLKYHGYDKFFPLWALARYRNERYAFAA